MTFASTININTSLVATNGSGSAPKLGENVVIGVGTAIIGDVRIGDDVIIGANSTVTKSFRNGVVIAGSPAKILHEKRS